MDEIDGDRADAPAETPTRRPPRGVDPLSPTHRRPPAEAPAPAKVPLPPAPADDTDALRAFVASIPVRAAWLLQRGCFSRREHAQLMALKRSLDAALPPAATEDEDRGGEDAKPRATAAPNNVNRKDQKK